MSAARPAVLIMATAARRGEVRRPLEPILGRDGCVALQRALIGQSAAWAHEVAPNAVHVAHQPPDAGAELRPLVGADANLFPQNGDGIPARLANAAARVFVPRARGRREDEHRHRGERYACRNRPQQLDGRAG